MNWWWPHVDHTPQGVYLGRKGASRTSPHGTFEGYLVGRMGYGEPFPIPLLDGSSAHDVIDACDMIGRLLGSPLTATAPPSSAGHAHLGFDALSSGPAHLVKALRTWLCREVPAARRLRGHVVAFGWIADRRHELPDHISDLLNTAMKKAVAAENRTEPRVLSDVDFHESDVGIEALAQRLGIARRGVASIASRLGILPERGWYRSRVHFDREQVKLIEECVADVVTTQEATRILGLPKFQLEPLVKAGLLDRISGVSGRNGTGNRYLKSQVEHILAEVLEGVPVGIRKESCSLIVCARHMRVEAGRVAALVAKGELKPCCRTSGRAGFMSLRFLDPCGVTYEQRRPTATPLKTIERIRGLALANPAYGCGRISKALKAEGVSVSGPIVQKHLIRMGLGRKSERIRAAGP